MPPKFDPSEVKEITLRATGGEVRRLDPDENKSTFAQAPASNDHVEFY